VADWDRYKLKKNVFNKNKTRNFCRLLYLELVAGQRTMEFNLLLLAPLDVASTSSEATWLAPSLQKSTKMQLNPAWP